MVFGRYNRDRHAPNKGIAGRGAAATDRTGAIAGYPPADR